MKRFLITIIRAYQKVLSPLMGNQCRFYPTCSHYAIDAIEQHGAFKGTSLAIWRILRCNPWHPGGFDYVPKTELSKNDCKHCNQNMQTNH